MDYEAGYVYKLMDNGGPTYVTEPSIVVQYRMMRL